MQASSDFNILFQQAAAIIKKIKQKNDFIVRGSVDSQQRLMTEINNDRQFFDREVRRLNTLIQQMEKSYVDPLTIKKIDVLKKQAKKQLGRNQELIKDLIKTTFETISQQNSHSSRLSPLPKHSPVIEMEYKIVSLQTSGEKSMLIQHQGTKLDEQLEQQKNKILKDFEKTIHEFHEILKQTEGIVHQHGQALDLISQAVQNTTKHVLQTKQTAEEASQHQKSHVKYWIIVLIVLIVVAGVVVTVLMLRK